MTNDTVFDGSAPKGGLTRRQVTNGALWSVPVILLAAATPSAAAASVRPGPASPYPPFVTTTSIARNTAVSPHSVRINAGSKTAYFDVPEVGGGDSAPGLYTSGLLSFTLLWGDISNSGSLYLTEMNLHGWARTGSLPAEGTTGTVTYTHASIFNGSTLAVDLPVLRLTPPTGDALPISRITTTLSAPYITPNVVTKIRTPTAPN